MKATSYPIMAGPLCSLRLLVAFALLCTWCQAQLNPGDPAPALSLPVLDGPAPLQVRPGTIMTLLTVINTNNPAHKWAMSNQWSLQTFLQLAPFDVDYVFMPLSGSNNTAKSLAQQWQDRMQKAVKKTTLSTADQKARLSQLQFVPCSAVQCAPWLANLTSSQWTVPGVQLTAYIRTPGGVLQVTASRLDGWYDWVPRPDATGAYLVAYADDVCSRLKLNVTGRWVLAPNNAKCSYQEMALNVQHAGGVGLMVHASKGADPEVMMPPDVDLDLTATPAPAAMAAAAAAQHGAARVLHPQDLTAAGDLLSATTHGRVGAVAQPSALRARLLNAATHTAQFGTHPAGMDASMQQLSPYPGLNLNLDADLPRMLYLQFPGPQAAARRLQATAAAETSNETVLISLTQISYEAGQLLKEMINTYGSSAADGDINGVVIQFGATQVSTAYVGINVQGQLFEVGWTLVPTLMQVAWQAQYQQYLDRLQYQQATSQDTVVSIFDSTNVTGNPGATIIKTLPKSKKPFTRLLVEMQLSCGGTRDKDCPDWDHVVQLFGCCGGDCSDCPITPFRSVDSKLPTAGPGKQAGAPNPVTGATPQCGFELGRWITPFKRRIGHWVTDVSPLLPFMQGGQRCQFTVQAPPWAPGWVASVALTFSTSQQPILPAMGHSLISHSPALGPPSGSSQGSASSAAAAGAAAGAAANAGTAAGRLLTAQLPEVTRTHGLLQFQRSSSKTQRGSRGAPSPKHSAPHPSPAAKQSGVVPFMTVPLFEGGVFNQSYNDRKALQVKTPKGTVRAIIFAYITGHGSDDNNCAEFCPTSHIFTVEGKKSGVTFDAAGTAWGCTREVPDGTIPNQAGTWYYGRNGWCPGQQVLPWLADVTNHVAAEGKSSSISYKGLFNGTTPDPSPEVTPGNILLSSYITFYKRASA